MSTRFPYVLAALSIALAFACGGGPSASGAPPGAASGAVPAAAQAAPTEAKYAASEILIRHAGAAGADAKVTRSEADARAAIDALWRRAAGGEPFDAIAKSSSEGSEAERGGKLGTYRTGTMVPEFERAVAAVKVGEITAPFHTAFGWHVAKREAVVEIGAREILVTYQGAWRSTSTRTRDDARKRVEAALAELKGGADFAKTAAKYSDDAAAKVGGDIGTVAPGQLVPSFEEAAFALGVGQRSDVVETPYGFHVIERTR